MTAPVAERRRRLWLALAGLTAASYGVVALAPDFFFALGVDHLGIWFLDTFAILAASDAVQRGLDPFGLNPLDYFQRAHVYSHWWLNLRHLGITRDHSFWLGLVIGVAFLITALLGLRPRGRRELGWYFAVIVSPPVVLGFNRANNDLVIFLLLAPVAPCLLSSSRPARFFAAVLVALAAGLKFYPAIAGLVLLAGSDGRETRQRLWFGASLLALVAVSVGPDVLRIQPFVPRADGLMSFSAFNLLKLVGLSGWPAVAAGGALALIAVTGFVRFRPLAGWSLPSDQRPWLGFVVGALLLTACFFTGRNYAYRWIFTLWLAPLLWSLAHDSNAPRRARRFAGLTAGLMMFVLWFDSLATAVLVALAGRIPPDEVLRWASQLFLAEQPVTWAFFWCLLGFLAHFATAAGRQLFRAPGRAASAPCPAFNQRDQVAQ